MFNVCLELVPGTQDALHAFVLVRQVRENERDAHVASDISGVEGHVSSDISRRRVFGCGNVTRYSHLHFVKDAELLRCLARFRTGSHWLRIQSRRFRGTQEGNTGDAAVEGVFV